MHGPKRCAVNRKILIESQRHHLTTRKSSDPASTNTKREETTQKGPASGIFAARRKLGCRHSLCGSTGKHQSNLCQVLDPSQRALWMSQHHECADGGQPGPHHCRQPPHSGPYVGSVSKIPDCTHHIQPSHRRPEIARCSQSLYVVFNSLCCHLSTVLVRCAFLS